nr:MAG TPA: hypothetical protein [Caudoviricetes sp.]
MIRVYTSIIFCRKLLSILNASYYLFQCLTNKLLQLHTYSYLTHTRQQC